MKFPSFALVDQNFELQCSADYSIFYDFIFIKIPRYLLRLSLNAIVDKEIFSPCLVFIEEAIVKLENLLSRNRRHSFLDLESYVLFFVGQRMNILSFS